MPRSKTVQSEYRNYELSPDFPLLALEGEAWRISPARSATLHFHNCLEIGFCREGHGRMVLNQREEDFREGDVTLIGSQVHHTTWSAPGSRSLWSYLFLDAEKLQGKEFSQPEALRELASSGSLILRAEDATWPSRLTVAILGEMRDREEGYQDCVRGLLIAFFSRVLRNYSVGAAPMLRENPLLMPALAWLREEYASDFSMEDLAARCHLSPTHFRRLFREQMGTTPLDFLHQVRISASCSLLLSTDDSVSAIAGQVGYASLSCFNRHFIRIMGMIPSRWRKAGENLPRPSLLPSSGWTRAETTEEILQKGKQENGTVCLERTD